MELYFEFSQGQTKYIAIYNQLKTKISQNVLTTHEKLPSKRMLAQQLNVSIHTVQEAYEQLASEGYIYSVERAGYFVANYEWDWQQTTIEKRAEPETHLEPLYPLQNGQVDAQAFPLKEWLKAYKKQLTTTNIPNSNWQGELYLRQQIARYVEKSRGFYCQPEQIYMYNGTQHQLQALCRFFGDVPIAMEEPGFKRVKAVFQQNKCPIEYVPVDEKGASLPKKPCRYYYVTPAHQFPLGMVMPMERKSALLKWATINDAYLIEDDYDAEFRYKGNPIPPLAQLDQLQRVIYFGTFSKTLLPSARISYMILPMQLVSAYNAFFSEQKATVAKIDQLVIADLMEAGVYTKHIAKMRTLYRKKRTCLLASLYTYFGTAIEVIGEDAGLHIILKLPAWLSEQQAIHRAQQVGIAIDAVSSSYQLSDVDCYVMLGYGAIPLQSIEEAIQLLAKQWQET